MVPRRVQKPQAQDARAGVFRAFLTPSGRLSKRLERSSRISETKNAVVSGDHTAWLTWQDSNRRMAN